MLLIVTCSVLGISHSPQGTPQQPEQEELHEEWLLEVDEGTDELLLDVLELLLGEEEEDDDELGEELLEGELLADGELEELELLQR